MSDSAATLGLAPHSGWAAAVAVGCVGESLRVLARERIEMADPRAPESRQPYHAVEGLPVAEAARRLAAYEARAGLAAQQAIAGLAGRLEKAGHPLCGVGILESSGRKGGALAAILASHALIHTADGDHFRAALAAAAQTNGLFVLRVPARALEAQAAVLLGKPPRVLGDMIQRLGRSVGPPWAADQKAAALLAWVVLTTRSSRNR